MQSLWNFVREHVGVEVLGHPLLFTAAIVTTVVVAGIGFSLVDVFVTKKVPLRDAVVYSLITLPGYLLVFVLLKWAPISYHVAVPASAPGMVEFIGDLTLCLIVGDLSSYGWHRLEHGSKALFRNVHHVHHRVARPLSVWSGFYVHPIESICVFTTFYAFPFLFGVHPLVFIAYAMLNTFVTMVTHCGYDMAWYPKSLFASAPMHEHHHAKVAKTSNFCVLLTLGDRLFGTFKV